MTSRNEAKNKAQDLKGKAKETVGKITGNDRLRGKGLADQTKAALKQAGEGVKQGAAKAKDAGKDAGEKVRKSLKS
jgi:uncharacterized protein YjbJ (UPF0337 family)